jgi:hypothetical protein
MNVRLVLDGVTIARFEYGIHAMWAARALSEEDERSWVVVDERGDEPLTIIEYVEGVAI